MGIRGRRLTKRQVDNTKAAIQTGVIVKHLQDHVAGTREMAPSQVTAGLGLLKKVLPDMAATQLTGPDGGPVQVNISIK